jgi:pimeloyl-ACP methyl ester carboxylesterase
MGGVIAVMAALERPNLVRRLVLSVTSGGVDLAAHGAVDWRPGFRKDNPAFPRWFEDDRTDLTSRLHELTVPVLLLWGDSDPISPVAVGERLAQLLSNAELLVIEGGTHNLVEERAAQIAPHVQRHLSKPNHAGTGQQHATPSGD